MKQGDNIKVRPAHLSTVKPALAHITGKIGDAMALFIEHPPKWLRSELQERGIFISPLSSWKMNLYHDHAGTWTDAMSLKHYAVEE